MCSGNILIIDAMCSGNMFDFLDILYYFIYNLKLIFTDANENFFNFKLVQLQTFSFEN